jgi:hypothetical protein
MKFLSEFEAGYNAITEFLPLKSNISAIHYFPTAETEICDEHTGLFLLTVWLFSLNLQTLESLQLLLALNCLDWRYGIM